MARGARVRDRATSIVSRNVAAFLSAESRDSVVEAGAWNNLCRFGGLVGAASEALSACERGVAVSGGRIATRDSRGIARALTGDFSGAIDDFNAFVNSDPEHRHANTDVPGLRNSKPAATRSPRPRSRSYFGSDDRPVNHDSNQNA